MRSTEDEGAENKIAKYNIDYRKIYKGNSKTRLWGAFVLGSHPNRILITFFMYNAPSVVSLIVLHWVIKWGGILTGIGFLLLLISDVLMFITACSDPGILKRSTADIIMHNVHIFAHD